MTTDLSVFKQAAVANKDLFERMMADTNKIAGLGRSMPRISIRGGRFRRIVGGEQVGKPKATPLNVVVIRASDINRSYYEEAYDPDNPGPPTCWSVGSETPSPDVPKDQRQSAKCSTCPMNVKGSGQGNSRACRFSMRLALALEGDLENIYQMQLPAMSIFGKAEGQDMGMQAYAKYLNANGLMLAGLVTEMSFDEDTEAPKLYFRPVRPLEEDEFETVAGLYESEEVLDAVEFSVSAPAEEGEAPKPKAKAKPKVEDEDEDEAPKPKAKAKPKPKVEAEPEDEGEDEIPEPKRRASSKKTKEADDDTSSKVAAALAQWDD